MDKFPFLTAELGGGLQVTHHRRPIASGLDTAAMTMVKLGSGANLLGYYMYHGGTNPKGKLTTLQETRATGYPNDLPAYSYDFNAPLREFGQMEDTYREVRLLSTFIHDFGDDLCDMAYTEQPGNPLKPDNLTDLRTAVRSKKTSDGEARGYLFVNNYQRRYKMAQHKDIELKAYSADGKTVLASFSKRDIEDGDFFFYPFNMPVGNALVTIDATPLCRLKGDGADTYVFYKDIPESGGESAEDCLDLVTADVKGDLGNNKIIVITRDEAVHSSKVVIDGKEYLIISEAEPVTKADGNVSLMFTTDKAQSLTFRAYPQLSNTPEGFRLLNEDSEQSTLSGSKENRKSEFYDGSDAFAIYESTKQYTNDGTVSVSEIDSGCFNLDISNLNPDANEVYMLLDYEGDTAEFIIDGDVATDSFYTGQLWEIGLKRYCDTCLKANVQITPLFPEDKEKMYLQSWPEMSEGKACNLNNVRLITQYDVSL